MLAQAELRDETEPAPKRRPPAEVGEPRGQTPLASNQPVPRTATVRQARAPEIRVAIAPRAVADLVAQSQPLHAPHRSEIAVASTMVAPLTNYASLCALVGVRTTRTSLDHVLAWRHELSDVPIPAVTQISDVVAQARVAATYWDATRLSADAPVEPPVLLRAGDLLVFDRAIDDLPASLVALVAATDDRGVSEFFYVAAGVIRRGFVDPKRPTLARDAERRIVNTFLRHKQNQPPAGTRFLAGELLAGVVRR